MTLWLCMPQHTARAPPNSSGMQAALAQDQQARRRPCKLHGNATPQNAGQCRLWCDPNGAQHDVDHPCGRKWASVPLTRELASLRLLACAVQQGLALQTALPAAPDALQSPCHCLCRCGQVNTIGLSKCMYRLCHAWTSAPGEHEHRGGQPPFAQGLWKSGLLCVSHPLQPILDALIIVSAHAISEGCSLRMAGVFTSARSSLTAIDLTASEAQAYSGVHIRPALTQRITTDSKVLRACQVLSDQRRPMLKIFNEDAAQQAWGVQDAHMTAAQRTCVPPMSASLCTCLQRCRGSTRTVGVWCVQASAPQSLHRWKVKNVVDPTRSSTDFSIAMWCSVPSASTLPQ
jgi:hypothetical protein